jgi:hypothetical protein
MQQKQRQQATNEEELSYSCLDFGHDTAHCDRTIAILRYRAKKTDQF